MSYVDEDYGDARPGAIAKARWRRCMRIARALERMGDDQLDQIAVGLAQSMRVDVDGLSAMGAVFATVLSRCESDDPFFNSREWLRLRYNVIKRDGGQCKACGARAFDGAILHVDHIKPRSKFPELALDARNLQVLCEPCNLGKSNTDQTDWRKSA